MDKSHSLSTPIAVRSLDVEINPFRPPKDDEDILGPEFIMSNNIAKLAFLALDITGKNYLSWVLDAEIHLDANGIGNTIKEGNETSVQDKAKRRFMYLLLEVIQDLHYSHSLLAK
ncbi:hypothetical protein Tco_0099841 [Tanacetum coccineum]